jgi:WhiB family redox-sensing transcriptional regulator
MAKKRPKQLPPLDIHGYEWMHHAACKGKTQLMFPKEHRNITYIAQARAICKSCPVKKPCLEYALEFPPADMHGVWAGLTSRQLAAEQRRRGVRPKRPTLAQLWGE